MADNKVASRVQKQIHRDTDHDVSFNLHDASIAVDRRGRLAE